MEYRAERYDRREYRDRGGEEHFDRRVRVPRREDRRSDDRRIDEKRYLDRRPDDRRIDERRSRDAERKPRSRSRSPYRRRGDSSTGEWEEFADKFGNPSHCIMLRGLVKSVSEQDIENELLVFGLRTKDIRVIKDRDTGENRGFAFVEFLDQEDSVKFMSANQGRIRLHDNWVIMHFSQPNDSNDWTCPACGVVNFKSRNRCFKCSISRESSSRHSSSSHNGSLSRDLVSCAATEKLLFQNLEPRTSETHVWQVIFPFLSKVGIGPPKKLRVQSRYATLECQSGHDATILLHALLQSQPPITMNGAQPMISFCKSETRFKNPKEINVKSQSAAEQAIAASGWSAASQNDKTLTKPPPPPPKAQSPADPNNPDPSRFQLEPTTGFYYDNSTGLYYDTQSKYFYNGQTQQYLYWDATQQRYLPVAGNAAPTPPTVPTVESEENSVEPVKKEKKKQEARKIAKDMEKWAKQLNAKRDALKSGSGPAKLPPEFDVVPGYGHGLADIGLAILEKKSSEAAQSTLELSVAASAELANSLVPEPVIDNSDEESLIDWSKLACLLCKRKFRDSQTLEKHRQSSDLHLSNLEEWKILNPPKFQYRDRAAERREKFGAPEPPMKKRKEQAAAAAAKENKEEDIFAVPTAPPPPPAGPSGGIGNKMLKAMGWKGGGLGKTEQGIADPVQVEQRHKQSGLGTKQLYNPKPGDTYRDTLWGLTKARFEDLNNI